MNVLIVMTKYTTDNNKRFPYFLKSIYSLISTVNYLDIQNKIVLIDNGENNISNEKDCLTLFHNNFIDAYVKVPNLNLGHGRNTGLDIGFHLFKDEKIDYVVFTDDDILFKNGWLEECVHLLEKYPDKLISTPVHSKCHMKPKYMLGELDGNMLNRRAGSNCSCFRLEDYEELGRYQQNAGFNIVGVCGRKFTDTINRKGFKMILTKEPMAEDICYKNHSYGKES